MPPSAEQLQQYRHIAQQVGVRVQNAVIKQKAKLKKASAKRSQKKTTKLLKKLGKI